MNNLKKSRGKSGFSDFWIFFGFFRIFLDFFGFFWIKIQKNPLFPLEKNTLILKLFHINIRDFDVKTLELWKSNKVFEISARFTNLVKDFEVSLAS